MITSADLAAAQQRIAAAYDPELFREAGQRVIVQLSEHLRLVQASGGSVLPWRDPAANVAEAARWLAGEPAGASSRPSL